jgi:hypothetical protein
VLRLSFLRQLCILFHPRVTCPLTCIKRSANLAKAPTRPRKFMGGYQVGSAPPRDPPSGSLITSVELLGDIQQPSASQLEYCHHSAPRSTINRGGHSDTTRMLEGRYRNSTPLISQISPSLVRLRCGSPNLHRFGYQSIAGSCGARLGSPGSLTNKDVPVKSSIAQAPPISRYQSVLMKHTLL